MPDLRIRALRNLVASRSRILVLFAVSMLAVACTSGADPTDTTDGGGTLPASTAVTDPSGGDQRTLFVGRGSDISVLDLGRHTSSHDSRVLLNVYDSLVGRDATGAIVPGLAREWESNEDFTEWTFHLQEGVLFHNGEEMTAEDVAFNVLRYADPDYPGGVAGQFSDVVGAEVVDDYAVTVTLANPNPRFFVDMALFRSPIVPKSIAEGLPFEEFGATPETAIGTGPYRIVEWIRDERLVLEAFDEHWRGTPPIKSVEILPIPEEASRVAALLADDVQLMDNLAIEQVGALEGSSATAVSVLGTQRVRLILNDTREPFSDIRMRQAVNHAIDKALLTDTVLEGYAEPLIGHALPNEVGFNPDLEEAYPYDPDRARELIAEAGYPDGLELDFPIESNYLKAGEVGEAIAGMLAEVGITLNVQVLEPTDFSNVSESKDLDIAMSGNGGSAIFYVYQSFIGLFHPERGNPVNTGFYNNDEFIALLDESLTVADEEAIPLWQTMDQIIQDDAGQVMLYHQPAFWGISDEVDFEPHATDSVWLFGASWKE